MRATMDLREMKCKTPRSVLKQEVLQPHVMKILSPQARVLYLPNAVPEYIRDVVAIAASNTDRPRGKTIFGHAKPRDEICYTQTGDPYAYSGIKHATRVFPFHVLMLSDEIRDLVCEYAPEFRNHVLDCGVDIIYGPQHARGGSIMAHSDDEKPWDMVLIYSLGQKRWLRMRNKSNRDAWLNIPMTHNSVVAMFGKGCQDAWTHQIERLGANEEIGIRLSVNLRYLPPM